MSLQELWGERRWRELLNLIDGLPSTSWTQEAIAMDEELVQQMLENKDPKELDAVGDGAPPLREWDQHASMLATVIEELRQLQLVIIASKSKKGTALPKLKNVIRPVSMYQKLAQKIRMDSRLRRHDDLVARLLGDRAKKD